MKLLTQRLVAAMLLVSTFIGVNVQAQTKEQIGNAILPPELVAAYTCNTFGAFYAGHLAEQFRKRGRTVSAKDIKVLVQKFDEISLDMCTESRRVFVRNKERVNRQFAKNFYENRLSDWQWFLTDPMPAKWAKENAKFLVDSLGVYSLSYMVAQVAPQTVGPGLSNRPYIASVSELDEQLKVMTPGRNDYDVRHAIFLALSDKDFGQLLPARFNVSELAKREQSTRETGASLMRVRFNTQYKSTANAVEITLSEFGSFDILREMGLTEVFVKAAERVKKLGETF